MRTTSFSFSRPVLVLSILLPVAGCSGLKTTNAVNNSQVSIVMSQASANLAPGQTQQFTATVTGTTNTAVTWAVDNVSGGNSQHGTISSSGLYTAPQQAGTHTVSATSVADSSKSANAAVTVFTFGIAPASISLNSGSSQQFTATLQGFSNAGVTWAVDKIAGGNATIGTVSASGLYTAPAQSGSHTVTATSAADTSATVSASVTVEAAVSISPASATLTTSATQQFTATVQGESSPSITWSVDGIAGGNATVGTISTSGYYTAPSQAGNHTIGAHDSTSSDSGAAQLTVFSFALSPNTAIISPGGTQQFSAAIQGLTNTGVTWSVDGISGGNSSSGTISSAGLYTAPTALGAHTISAASVAYPSDIITSQVTVTNVVQSAVLTYHNDDARDGAYVQEVTLTPQNVNSSQFGKIFSYSVDGQIYGQPLYLPQLNINGGAHDVVFVATQNNSVYAFDADATSGSGTTFWHVNFGTPKNAYDLAGPYPVVGILSTPVIDATSNTIYVVTHQENASPEYWLHALDVTTGKDRVSPVGILGSVGSDHLGSGCYQRMGLALDPVTNWIYVPIGSCPSGWMFAYDKTTLQQKAVFDATPNAGGGGFWGGGAAPAIDDSTGDIYVMNGVDGGDQEWISSNSMTGYNDCFLRMDATNLSVLDYFAPDDNIVLATNDVDLGSGGNVLVPGSSSYPHEVLGGGKDGNVFVVNRDSMGGYNSQSNNVLQTVHTGTSQYDNIFSTPVYWNGMVFIHPNNDVLHAFSWNESAAAGQQLSSKPVASANAEFGQHGATPSLSANGTSNGIIWDIDNSAYDNAGPNSGGPAVLHAYDATNVANELYNSAQAGSRDQAGLALKFTTPTIANGKVFVSTTTELDIYGLLGQ